MAREEGDSATAGLAQEEGIARRAVGRLDSDLGHIVEEGVEAGTADDTDLCLFAHAVTLRAYAWRWQGE